MSSKLVSDPRLAVVGVAVVGAAAAVSGALVSSADEPAWSLDDDDPLLHPASSAAATATTAATLPLRVFMAGIKRGGRGH